MLHAARAPRVGLRRRRAPQPRGPDRRALPGHPPGLRLPGLPRPPAQAPPVRAARRARAIGMTLTESLAMLPGRLGQRHLHPAPGGPLLRRRPVTRDQVEDYAAPHGHARGGDRALAEPRTWPTSPERRRLRPRFRTAPWRGTGGPAARPARAPRASAPPWRPAGRRGPGVAATHMADGTPARADSRTTRATSRRSSTSGSVPSIASSTSSSGSRRYSPDGTAPSVSTITPWWPSNAWASRVRTLTARWGAAARAAASVSGVSSRAPVATTSRPMRASRAAQSGRGGSAPSTIVGSTGSCTPSAASSSLRTRGRYRTTIGHHGMAEANRAVGRHGHRARRR